MFFYQTRGRESVSKNDLLEHNRMRNQCKDCGGSGICEHNRRRNVSEDCHGSQICYHNRVRYRCNECLQCPVCLRKRAQNVAFNCEHIVCTDCAPELPKCPLCRAEVYSYRLV